MITRHRTYAALLSLYPARFYNRFGREMAQIFDDCYQEQATFWIRTIWDLTVSIPREWRREWVAPDSAIDFTGIVDAIVVSIVVGSNLLGWGWLFAATVLNLNADQIMGYWRIASVSLSVVVTISAAALIGILSALAVGRARKAPAARTIKI